LYNIWHGNRPGLFIQPQGQHGTTSLQNRFHPINPNVPIDYLTEPGVTLEEVKTADRSTKEKLANPTSCGNLPVKRGADVRSYK